MTQDDAQTKAMTSAGLNLIAQALTIYDRELKLAVCNAPFQAMFDLPDWLTTPGASFEDTIRYLAESGEYGPLDDVDVYVADKVQISRAFEPHYMERTRSNGRTISVEGSPLPQGGWVTVYTDITQTKRSEALLRARSEELSDRLVSHSEDLAAANRELAATNAALAEAKRELTEIEARTRLVTEMMPAHIAHVNAAGQYTYSNRRLSAIMPGRPADVMGMTLAQAVGPQIYPMIHPHLQAAFRGESAVFEFTEPQDARRLRAAFTPDGQGGAYILSMDVTAETQARAALQQSRRREIAAQMTSGIAHDFSNLLTIILGMQSRLSRMDLEPEAAGLVAATRAAADRGGRLLHRLADMTGQRTPRPQATDMHAFLADLKLLATPSLPQAVEMTVLDHCPDRPLMLDPGMLQDALLNLILNARDACSNGGQITITAHPVSDIWLELAVADTGTGFSPEALEKALHPFFTTKGDAGSGLGLPMVYDMVKMAGGTMDLGNWSGGAEVRLRLPLRLAPAGIGGLALLVEDNVDLRTDYRAILMSLGYAVIEATSVEEARTLLADLDDIALILSDIRLEGSATGLDLAAETRAGQTPLVLMTSLPVDDPLHRAALTHGPVLQKPFTVGRLAALLGQAEAA
ncbi:hybrid sensor histidine kinase/response regulator [Chachezhania sediminis]|uniref:hybrid sensor histidine kinase/response regulator n=1 Tax=Chachezhania sediminis TaxID=2599291 RepID=UPI00131DAE0C|nr:PAS-domain containing protein [Chachezhania sediminis]